MGERRTFGKLRGGTVRLNCGTPENKECAVDSP